jgi:hypothetical protein
VSVQRYRPKPERTTGEDQFAARYEPGRPLDDLIAVARMADDKAELAEVTFPSGPVLAVRWTRIPDDHPSEVDYEMIEPGKYLAYSTGNDFLYDSTDTNWRQFYDLVAEVPR